MTKQFFSLFLTAVACFVAQLAMGQNSNAQYDDLYFDGVEETPSYSQTRAELPEATNNYQQEVYEDEVSTTESIQQNTRSYESYAQERGNADPYDYQFASRIRRFHNPAPGFSYYSNYYVDNYWYDPYAPNFYGTSIYIGPSLGWSRWNRWDNWGYNPYNRWNNPWGWNNGWNNPYCGFNNGWGWRNNVNNGFGWNNGWNTGYNYVASTPNAGNFTNSIRGVRGASVSRVNGQHVASSPRGRSNTSNIDNVRSNRSNGRSNINTPTTTRNGYDNTRVTTNGNRTTIVRDRNSTPRRSYDNSNSSNTRSSSRGTYTPSTRSSSSSSRGSYTPSRSSSSNSRSSSGASSSRSSSRSSSSGNSSRSSRSSGRR